MFQVGLADARLPVEPGLSQQLFEDPAVDIAAVVVADVDDQSFAIEDRIELTLPLRHVVAPHRAQVHVSDLASSCLFDGEPSGVLPFVVSHVDVSRVRLIGATTTIAWCPARFWRDPQ